MKWPSLIAKNGKKFVFTKKKSLVGLTVRYTLNCISTDYLRHNL
jgi:hypothetical protein